MKKNPLLWIVAMSLCSLSATYAAQSVILESVAVEGENEASSTLNLSHSKTAIHVEELSNQPTNLNEALRDTFFVNYKKAGEYNSEPYIRGRGINGVPIYIEGMRINAAHPDSTNLFNMIDAEEVDVYRGANSANVGMGAMNGAVVIKLKEPKFSTTDEFQMSSFIDAKTSLFSQTGYTTAIGATLYNQFVNLSLSGSISEYNNYSNGSGDEVLHSDSDNKHFNIATAVKTGDDSYIYGRYMKDKSSSADPLSRYQQGGVWFYNDHPNDDAKTYFFGFRKGEWYGLSDIDLQFFGNDVHYDVNTKKESSVPYATELYRESETKGVKLSAKKEVDEHHLLSFSMLYSRMEISNGVRQWNSGTGTWNAWSSAFGIKGGDITTVGAQIVDDIKYDKAFYTLAAGYENVKRNVTSNVNTTTLDNLIPDALDPLIQKTNTDERDNLFSFSAKAGYEISPAFIPYIKLSNAERTPYFNEAYGNNPSNGSLIPNQTLVNEKVWDIDLGMDGKYERFYYTSALYYQRYSNYIELAQTGYVTTGNLPIKRYVNLDEATIYGAEVMAGYELGKDLFVEATYLYTHGQNEGNDTPLAFIAPQKLTLALAQKRTKGLSWKIEEVFVDNQDRISSVNGEVATPGYSLTNASMSYGFSKLGLLKNAVVSFELNNIFDKSYREHLDKVSSTAWYLPDNAGINGVLSLKATF